MIPSMVADDTTPNSSRVSEQINAIAADTRKRHMLSQVTAHPNSKYNEIVHLCKAEGGSLPTIKRNIDRLQKQGLLSFYKGPRGVKSYHLSELGKEVLAGVLSTDHSSQSADRQVVPQTSIPTPSLYKINSRNWFDKLWDISLHTERELIMTTTSASAWKSNKKFISSLLEKFKNDHIDFKLVAVRGRMPKQRLRLLRRYGAKIRLVNINVLSDPRHLLTPKLGEGYPSLRDIGHVTVSDGVKWMYTESKGSRNTKRGFGYADDRFGAAHMTEILQTIWVTALDK